MKYKVPTSVLIVESVLLGVAAMAAMAVVSALYTAIGG